MLKLILNNLWVLFGRTLVYILTTVVSLYYSLILLIFVFVINRIHLWMFRQIRQRYPGLYEERSDESDAEPLSSSGNVLNTLPGTRIKHE